MSSPQVSVLMPIYNGERYLRQAMDSILAQTFTDFEFLIVNDGSTDNTAEILAEYASRDQRVAVVNNERNLGLVNSLNRGLDLVQGQYIARMDADDISLPNRLRMQVDYMEQRPDVGVLGTSVRYIDHSGQAVGKGQSRHKRLESPFIIAWTLLWKCAISHPTVMMRRDVLERTGLRYRTQYEGAEDYDLWTHLGRFTVVDRLLDVTVHYRVLPTSISRRRRLEQERLTGDIVRRQIAALFEHEVSPPALEALVRVFVFRDVDPSTDFEGASDLLLEVYRRFLERPHSRTDQEMLQKYMVKRQVQIARKASEVSSKQAVALLGRASKNPVKSWFSVDVLKSTGRIAFSVIRNAAALNTRKRPGKSDAA